MCTGAEIGLVVGAASTAVQASGTLSAGRAEQQAAAARAQALEHQAAQARQQAGQERASSQRSASEKRRLGKLLASRALAVAAASGAGAGDPTVELIVGDIGAEGEFRALSAQFEGEERARGLETQADLKIFESEQERRAGAAALSASRGTAFAEVLGGVATAAGSDVFNRNPGSKTPPIPKRNPRLLQTTASSGRGLSRYG